MYLECQLVFKNYKPLKLEKGMFFITEVMGINLIKQLEQVPFNQEEFIQLNGYPVEPYIIDINDITEGDEDDAIVATPDQIGWFDEGEHSDELSDISLKNINQILEQFDGWVDLEMTETEDNEFIPLLYNNKVTIRLVEDYDNDDWDDDIDEEPIDNNDDYNAIY